MIQRTTALTLGFLPLGLTAMQVSFGASSNASADQKPNIILLFVDDLGWMDLGVQGSFYYETPNIDRLAQEGVRFTDAYASAPNCAPSRASLLTGQYTARQGLFCVHLANRLGEDLQLRCPPNNAIGIEKNQFTMAEALKEQGYATFMIGKWHLDGRSGQMPDLHGFDEWSVFDHRYAQVNWRENRALYNNNFRESPHWYYDFKMIPRTEVPEGVYQTDYFHDQTLDFISRHRDQPFFIYLSYWAVHEPVQAKPELIERFDGKPPKGGHRDPVYAACLASVDQGVGWIRKKLEELGIADNTMIVFTSDNGGCGEFSSPSAADRRGATCNRPLKGSKRELYEGGIRVPLIIHWPGVIPAGGVSREPVNNIDFYPTFIEAAGAERNPKQVLDGVSLMPVLQDPSADLGRENLFWHFPAYVSPNLINVRPASVIRNRDYKLMYFYEDERTELYNLADDIGETEDLSYKKPDKERRLRDELFQWVAEIDAPLPLPVNHFEKHAQSLNARRIVLTAEDALRKEGADHFLDIAGSGVDLTVSLDGTFTQTSPMFDGGVEVRTPPEVGNGGHLRLQFSEPVTVLLKSDDFIYGEWLEITTDEGGRIKSTEGTLVRSIEPLEGALENGVRFTNFGWDPGLVVALVHAREINIEYRVIDEWLRRADQTVELYLISAPQGEVGRQGPFLSRKTRKYK